MRSTFDSLRDVCLTGLVLAFAAPLAQAQDPLPDGAWTQVEEVEFHVSDSAPNFELGRAADLDAGTLVLSGGLFDDAAIYVLVRETGGWIEQARIKPEGILLTPSCALDGSTLVLSDWLDDEAGADCGAVYVYERSAGAWTLEAKIMAEQAQPDDFFGAAVDIDGSTLVVGAPRWHSAFDLGRVFVFSHDGMQWVQQTVLSVDNPVGGGANKFGSCVAIEADTIVVGANEQAFSRGSCFVFRKGPGGWQLEAELVGSGLAATDGFGSSVALAGESLAIGAPGKDANRGAAYVFVRAGAVWSQQAELSASFAAPSDYLGASVALDEDTLAVGAVVADQGRVDAGAVALFSREGQLWTERARLLPSDPESGARFGDAVALDSERTVVTASRDGTAGFHSGSVYDFPHFEGAASNTCGGFANSSGLVARMALLGEPQPAGGLTLFALGAPAFQSGLFFFGPATASLPFGNGLLCIDPAPPGIARLVPSVVTDAHGSAWYALPPLDPLAGAGPGLTLYFQFWFRDPAGLGAGFNLSDALGVTFVD